jgi:hypothetical protein
MTPVLEELSELEVELPAGRRSPLSVNLVEPIPDVHTQRSKGTQSSGSEAEAPEQTRRVKLARRVPNVAAFEEGVYVKRLIDPEPQLARTDEEGVSEGRPARLALIGVRVESARSDRELVVAAERLAVLRAADRECFLIE